MPTKSEHEAIIIENRNLISFIKAKRLQPDDYNSWVAVVLFYEIVHFTESLLADVNEHSNNHKQREDFLTEDVMRGNRNKRDYIDLWKCYSSAKLICNRSRYYCVFPTCDEIDEEQVSVDDYIALAGRLLPNHIKQGCLPRT